MSAALVVGIAVVGLTFWLMSRARMVVPGNTAVVVERLGRYSRTLGAGRSFIVPLIETCAHRHSLVEQRVEIDGYDCVSQDNVVVNVDAWLAFRVADPRRASYEIADLGDAVVALTRTALRVAVGKTDVERWYDERETMARHVIDVVAAGGAAWGIVTEGARIEGLRRGRGKNPSADLKGGNS